MRVKSDREWLYAAHPGACDLGVIALVINIEQFTRLTRIEKKTVRTDELQRVPLRGIVTRSDRDSPVRFSTPHLQLHCRHRNDTDVDDAAAARKDSGDHRVFDHLAGRARIATDYDRPRSGVRAERLRETRQQPRCQRLTDHATHTRDTDF